MTRFHHFGFIVVILFTAHLEERVLAREPCIKKVFVQPVPNKALINHVIRTPIANSEEICRIRCFMEIKCESYNFGAKEDGDHVCELSDSDASRDPLDWITKHGFQYRETQNPCSGAHCPVNARCYSDFENDTYACVCLTGFTGSNCETRIDKCQAGRHDCHINATCSSTKGSYNCTCKQGFYGDGRNSCKDVDECTEGLHSCHRNATCNNTKGSYNCSCQPGFQGDGKNSCNDIDECKEGLHGCHSNAMCNNTDGSYNCTCKPGFIGDGKDSCNDVDECTGGLHSCHRNATCENTKGSYNCSCKPGFQGDGKNSCNDIDECKEGLHSCHSNATCHNTNGSHICSCKQGYHGDGKKTCHDIDECKERLHGCHKSATCNNTKGSYNCTCKPGFFGDGKTSCNDIDECTDGLHSCHGNATCWNSEGSHSCTCNPGFVGNGKNCTLNGTLQELAVASCQSLSSATHPSGIYWVNLNGKTQAKPFKVYCEMETDGGGWTLVWSYTFTNYGNFGSLSNAVVPRPVWPTVGPNVNVPVSTTPPLNETDFNAMDFLLWKQFGKEILIKSNINNWITCSPGKGSLVDWQIGNIYCKITKHLSDNCLQVPAPSYLRIVRTPAELIFDCGPVLLGSPSVYYYFDGCTKKDWPTHDPCAQNNQQALQHVINPHGNIFLR